MRYITLVLLIWIGMELPSLAYDLPQTPNVVESNFLKPSEASSTMLQIGTVVGGGLLAAAALVGGLWLSRKGKPSKTN